MTKEVCPTCGHLMGPRKERLSKGLLTVFSNFSLALHAADTNCLHLQTEMNLTKSEYNNFQKLRYHDLVMRVGGPGCWGLTQLGRDFLYGAVEIPRTVYVKNNKVIRRGSDVVFIYDLNMTPGWEDYWDQFEPAC